MKQYGQFEMICQQRPEDGKLAGASQIGRHNRMDDDE